MESYCYLTVFSRVTSRATASIWIAQFFRNFFIQIVLLCSLNRLLKMVLRLEAQRWSMLLFSRAIFFMEIIFKTNKVFYKTIHPGRITLITSYGFLKGKVGSNIYGC